jgi:LAS superfamily LD-carboxypeptidase LdcB
VAVLLVVAGAVATFVAWHQKSATPAADDTSAPDASQNVSDDAPQPLGTAKLKQFTPEEFASVSDGTAYPNVQMLGSAPRITANGAADSKIAAAAHEAGLGLAGVPVTPIDKLDEATPEGDAILLQPKAHYAWLTLKQLADKDKVKLVPISGYRTIELQRSLFSWQLQQSKVTADDVAAGKTAGLNTAVTATAPPGYSRHHTGYTLDFSCGAGTSAAFKASACYKWLSGDNFAKAKQAGWVPSYFAGGKGAADYWPYEFIWVGQSAVSQ